MVDMSSLFRAVCTEMNISVHNKDLFFYWLHDTSKEVDLQITDFKKADLILADYNQVNHHALLPLT